MTSPSLTALLTFTKFTTTFRQVKREVLAVGEDRYENDAEHSYQLALTAWYLITKDNLPLNLQKVFQYALAHDLVEAYAGDLSLYDRNERTETEKERREHAALNRIKKEFPEATGLTAIIEQYERRSDAESTFVYALDKLLPVLNNYTDNGRSWQKHDASFSFFIKYKDKTIALDDVVNTYWKELRTLLENDKQKLFPRD